MESVTIYRVNAFTEHLFHGNPAGVCITEQPLPDELMKNIAMEMAVSETAFITLQDMRLRWFTPVKEVSLCGHATLSAAHILYNQKKFIQNDSIVFQTRAGSLVVRAAGDLIEMEFPLVDVVADEAGQDFIDALGLKKDDILFEGRAGMKHLLQVNDEDILNTISPDFSRMLNLPGRGVIVTSLAKDIHYDFVSRYFAPWVGVNEDPVTGSAHCALMPYWYGKNGKSKMTARQNSARGGEVMMELADNKVIISGKAVLALQGALMV